MSEFKGEPQNHENKIESLSSDSGGQGDRAYHILLARATNNGWPIPDRAKAKAILIAMRDLSHPSPRVRAAAARNLAMFDRINTTREATAQRADAISKLTEIPLLTREDLLTNLEVLRQQRLLVAPEEATESTNIECAEDIQTERLGQVSLPQLAISTPHQTIGEQSPRPADPA